MCFRNPKRECPFCQNAPEFKPDFDRLARTPVEKRESLDGECPWCLMECCVKENLEGKRWGDSYVEYPLDQFRRDCGWWMAEKEGRNGH